ncbi:LuxR C-terminal-related transcriptional regulator [Sinomonas sp. JGH33]|uniref:LuxR C-terminal-related transcriptional regulator n=1 Tax=Sinomonas terricola TaxID=3110330 RepID=A0ABU5T3A3_9MICC|nr:LuxR C-terminal-related transcriptional regulator [Sinomonas sp. JGH33]MEA5454144.1 LuxR C-terminal-related transcriptional regulator [Sinomonas sp. JGH33]
MPQTLLESGRKLYDARAWADAFAAFERAGRDSALPAADLERYAFSAYLIGREELCIDLLGRAFRGFLAENDGAATARMAFWLASMHGVRRDAARAEAWGRRLAGIVDDEGLETERALVALGLSSFALWSRDPADTRRALELSREAIAIARPAKDTDTEVFSRLNAGLALLRLGSTSEGLAQFDEAMATVTSGEVRTPLVNGIAYCSVISASLQASDVARAREWTTAATDWCAQYPDLVPFRGLCLVHRSVVKMLDGDWQGALDEAMTAGKRLLPGERAEFLPAYVEVMAAAGDSDAARSPPSARLCAQPAKVPSPSRGSARHPSRGTTSGCRTSKRGPAPHSAPATPPSATTTRLPSKSKPPALRSNGSAPPRTSRRSPGQAPSSSGPLTAREVDVVRLVARGLTNRAVAEELMLSEKTVARHLANIYAKLGIASRAAATAYAYDHGLVERP